MPATARSLSGSSSEAMGVSTTALKEDFRVAVPAVIQSFDPEKVTCSAQPAIRAICDDHNGKPLSVQLPIITDIPVIFPRGGGCTLTFPVRPGDECLLVFADRCIDFWWQNGGVQEPVDLRQHDLSDAFALVGPQSQTHKISDISTSATQLRTDDGTAFIEVATGHDITVKTPGKLTASAEGGTEITSPTITLNGNVTINGNLSQGMGESGGSATMLGPITVTNDVNAGGKSLQQHTHREHDGPETGPAQ